MNAIVARSAEIVSTKFVSIALVRTKLCQQEKELTVRKEDAPLKKVRAKRKQWGLDRALVAAARQQVPLDRLGRHGEAGRRGVRRAHEARAVARAHGRAALRHGHGRVEAGGPRRAVLPLL